MSPARLILRSLAFHWRTGVVVVLGLGVATGVMTGSLVIGDSMTGSLRDTALARLGRIDHALVAPGFFREGLGEDLARDSGASGALDDVCVVLQARGAARHPETGAIVPGVVLLGVDAEFWRLHDGGRTPNLVGRECAVSAVLASDLGLVEGDSLLVATHKQSAVSAGNLFARRGRKDTAPSLRLRVKRVLAAGGVGDLRLDAQSAAPRNVFVSRGWSAARLGKEGRANVLLAACSGGAAEGAGDLLAAGVKNTATLADHGLKLKSNSARGYLSLTSDGLVLSDAQVGAALRGARDCRARSARTSVYLATDITKLCSAPAAAPPMLAYAVIAGAEPIGPGPEDFPGTPEPGMVWLNSWAAEGLGVGAGDRVEVGYLVPTDDGAYPTARVELGVSKVLELSGAAADPGLAPDFEGITDAEHIDDWDPPFPVDLRRITARDEEYWDRHRATPKAFVSLDTVRAMWQSAPGGERADWVTSVRIAPPAGMGLGALESDLRAALLRALTPEASGLVFRPVREEALAASEGTSDFGELFLGLSMFLVLSGAGFAATLLRLSVDRRAQEAGIMLACGCGERLVRRTLLAEGAALTVLGALVGVPAGLLYAAGIIAALGSWWEGALGTTSVLWLHVVPGALVIGGLSGVLVGLGAAAWSTRRLGKRRALELLGGWQAMAVSATGPGTGRAATGVLALVVVAGIGATVAGTAGVISPQTAFFATGCALLAAGLAGSRMALGWSVRIGGAGRSLARLSVRNVAAASSRSLLVVGLLSAATFVVVAVAANTRDLSRMDFGRKESGTGGFALLAKSSVPLGFDLGSRAGRANLGFTEEDEAAFEGTEIISFLVSRGEDISCLNLARPKRPRVLGVPDAMIERGGFSPIAKEARGDDAWGLLRSSAEEAIPAFGDADSVRWTLHSGLGETYTMPGADGRPVELRFAGVLPGSVFAGEILVGEAAFRRLFPSVTSPAKFLIAAPAGREEKVAAALRRNLGELGLDVRSTRETLAGFMRVQNTYLSMFLALGGLGLLLGTVGTAAALVRGALERRGELALMSATGFGQSRLAALLLLENGGLLMAGLALGTISALVAMAPQLASAESQVNWGALSGVLVGTLGLGLVACAGAVRSAAGGSLIAALREE